MLTSGRVAPSVFEAGLSVYNSSASCAGAVYRIFTIIRWTPPLLIRHEYENASVMPAPSKIASCQKARRTHRTRLTTNATKIPRTPIGGATNVTMPSGIMHTRTTIPTRIAAAIDLRPAPRIHDGVSGRPRRPLIGIPARYQPAIVVGIRPASDAATAAAGRVGAGANGPDDGRVNQDRPLVGPLMRPTTALTTTMTRNGQIQIRQVARR